MPSTAALLNLIIFWIVAAFSAQQLIRGSLGLNSELLREKHTLENRLTELESCVAFQDDTIRQLNDVVSRQQKQIDALESALSELKHQFNTLMPSLLANHSEETPPPHY